MSEQFLILVGVITGLTEVIKRAGVDSKYSPAISVGLGVVLSYFFIGTDAQVIYGGIIASLTASGLYSGVKASVKPTV